MKIAIKSTIKNQNSKIQVAPWGWFKALAVGMLALLGADIAVAIGFGVLAGTFDGASTALGRFFGGSTVVASFVFYALSRLLGLGIIVLFLRKYSVKLRQLGFKKFRFWHSLALVLLAVVALIVATSVIIVVLSKLAPSLDLAQDQEIVFTQAKAVGEIALAFVALVVIAPIVEEIVFRGFMLPTFAKKFGWRPAVLMTSLLFGLVHWQLNVGIITFIMGLLLAWLYKKTGSLWPAILFHSLKNLVAFLIIF